MVYIHDSSRTRRIYHFDIRLEATFFNSCVTMPGHIIRSGCTITGRESGSIAYARDGRKARGQTADEVTCETERRQFPMLFDHPDVKSNVDMSSFEATKRLCLLSSACKKRDSVLLPPTTFWAPLKPALFISTYVSRRRHVFFITSAVRF
jgi:hypothetical protein